ncbi:MAG: hypothetical protein EOP04_02215 [Proteobacteria bacterium]|nr:MAG: hypothetical protein EOP04_02215 [Pseudomonadota bacterium]
MESINNPNQQDITAYIAGLEYKTPVHAFPRSRDAAMAGELIQEGKEQSFLSDKSIVSFVSGVSGQNREDVLNSTLLAQLVADKQAPIEKDMTAWYNKYTEVLRNVGWVAQAVEVNNYEVKESLFEVETVILEILGASFGTNYLAIIKKTLDSLKQMSQAGDGKLKVFEKNTQTLSKGCFQLGLATEENGAVAVQLGTFLLTSKNKVTKILFVKLRSDETSLDYATGQVSLNTKLYSEAAREVIQAKLKKVMMDYIAEIEL